MATISGSSTVQFNQSAEYILRTSESVDDRSVVWTLSTVVGKQPYEVKDSGKMATSVGFTNNNTFDLNVIIRVDYRLTNGTKCSPLTKKVTLLAKKTDKTTPETPKEATPDTGSKSAMVSTADDNRKDESEDTKDTVLKIHVYFDGTFGNKENIKAMETARNNVLDEYKPDIHNDKYKLDNGVDRDRYESDLEAYKKKVENNKDSIQDDLEGAGILRRSWDLANSESKFAFLSKAAGNLAGADPTSEKNSYTQVYTNIPIIFDMEDIESEEDANEEKIIKVYIEGVGTKDGMYDDFLALATGSDSGGRGIPSKVNRAFEEIEKETEDLKIDKITISRVDITVIGFSRGAATSRSFVAERDKMLSTLKGINKSIKDEIITYTFVGIFDTVCSVTDILDKPKFRFDTGSASAIDTYITSLQKNNIKDYKLAMGDRVKNVVHLVAADEHRLFFPLTNINTSLDAGCGLEILIPGSHCDIGGGDYDVLEEAFSESVMNKDKDKSLAQWLMRNRWFPQTNGYPILDEGYDVSIPVNSPYYSGYLTTKMGQMEIGRQYSLKRKVIAGFNRIPLAIMLHFATKFGEIKFAEKDEADRTKIHDELLPVKNKLEAYAKGCNKKGRDDTPVTIFNREFNHLRETYLHLSAVLDFEQDISDDISNIAEIKDIARINSKNEPDRADLSDRTDWQAFKKFASDTTDQVVDAAKEKAKEVMDGAKEKIGNTIEKGVEEIKDAAKESAKKALKDIIDKVKPPTFK